MNEAEITYQVSEDLNRIWVMQQWWASISIGVLVMAHLASARLNLLLLVIGVALYTCYTLYMSQMMVENILTVEALANDLQALIDAGVAQSHNAQRLVGIMETDATLYNVTFAGTYVCAVGYLIYSYVMARRGAQADG